MFPQQQSTGQIQGSQYLGFGSFNLTFTGGVDEDEEEDNENLAGTVGYLSGVAEVNAFHPNNSTQIKLILTNPALHTSIDSAVVTLTVTDSNGTELGDGWPVTMSYVSGSKGMYRATLHPLNEQQLDEMYSFKFDATYADLTFQCEVDVQSKDNTF